jgi:parallel beta-helix repeat protein
MKHISSLIIISLLLSSSFIGLSNKIDQFSINNGSNNVLYVGGEGPGNYSKIQDAINDSDDGDTIFVYIGTYSENLIIEKSLNIYGENRNNTIIDGRSSSDVIYVLSSNVKISGFNIQNSGSNSSDSGIELRSSYNIIIDNIIKSSDSGIRLNNANHNMIINNNLSENDFGLRFLNNSQSNIALNNSINLNKFWGVRLEDSEVNNISNNNIFNNGNGLFIKNSDKNNLLNNIISDNWYGIEILSSNEITIKNTSFKNDDLYVYDSYKNIILNNTVDEKPLIYLENESDQIIENIAGQIILVNCKNISILDQVFSDLIHPVELWGTDFCKIIGCSILNNDFGIALFYSNNNIISDSIFSGNNHGINLGDEGENNTIFNNTFKNNNFGLAISHVNKSTQIFNNYFSNNSYGLQIYNSKNATISNNTFTNDYFGLNLFFKSSNNNISSNIFENCGSAIWLNSAINNVINDNIIIESYFDGIWLLFSINNVVKNNAITDCKISIDIMSSNINDIFGNLLISGGIAIYNSFQNNVSFNTINGKPLVYLEDISGENIEEAGQVILINCSNILVQNLEISNTFFGIELWNSNLCQIFNNTFFNNYHSLYISESNNNSISNNEIFNYLYFGINSFLSNDNNIYSNEIGLEEQTIKEISLKNTDIKFIKEILKIDSINNNLKNSLFLIHPFIFNGDNNSNLSKCMYFISCQNNNISKNIIQNNQEGLIFKESKNNIIKNNDVKKNDIGIHFDKSNQNKIIQNNFIKNKKSAFFIDSKNSWHGNYWNRPRIIPKPIFGKINIWFLTITWFNIDWIPAKIPFTN